MRSTRCYTWTMSARDEASRTLLVVGLLIVSLGTASLLAWQAHRAVQSHRETAENVLEDYASLAAEELVRRASSTIGYRGYYGLLGELPGAVDSIEALESAVSDLRAKAEEDDTLGASLTLARRFFLLPAGASSVQYAGDDPTARGLHEWLEREIAGADVGRGPYQVAHGVTEGEPVTIVFREGESGSILGFVVELDAFEDHLASVLDEDPLLPPSLGRGETSNQSLFVAFRDHGGVERFRSGERFVARFGAEARFGETYQGVLEGSSVRVSIDPEAAEALVIGGLPPSRLPALGGLLLVNAALLATAILQIRRERELQRLRSEFVASASHELRTPLTQIRMFAETLLLGRSRSEDETARALHIIDREVRRLTHIVDNLLQFSRADRRALVVTSERAPLEPKIRETLDLFQPLAAESDARVAARLEKDARAAHDPDALGQTLLNLLDNAVKYGPPGQEIRVELHSRNGGARLVVEDDGPGIPEAERERVFERFYRLERDRDSAVAGTGVGLAVVRDLVALQGGRAFVEAGAGDGCRFVVELPGGSASKEHAP